MKSLRTQPGSFIAALFLLASLLSGMSCQETRTEYHTRPDFYKKAALGELKDEYVLDDGTIVKYRSPDAKTSLGQSGADKGKTFQMREEMPDGKIVLRDLLPEHVIVNTLICLRNEEYEVLYRQLIAEQTKLSYEAAGQSEEQVTEFFHENRHELVGMLTRMVAGLPHEEVSMKNLGGGVTRCKLRPQIAEPFKFKSVDVVKEGGELKLLMIR